MKKFTESKVEELRGLDRDTVYADVHSGLILIVRKQQLDKLGNDISKKVWAFRYRPKGKSANEVIGGDVFVDHEFIKDKGIKSDKVGKEMFIKILGAITKAKQNYKSSSSSQYINKYIYK